LLQQVAGHHVHFGRQLLGTLATADNIDGSQDISFLSVLSVLSLLSHQQIARGWESIFPAPGDMYQKMPLIEEILDLDTPYLYMP
jgi:hypothetical protein